MESKSMSRRFVLKLLVLSPICAMFSNVASAGDFAYEPTSETYWPRNLVRAVQSRLKELGFDPGPIDGIYGPKTRQGITAFQRVNNLNIDGKISNELIGALGLD